MKKICFLILCVGLGLTTALAQDWRLGADGGSEYNCEIVNAIVDAYGDRPYLRRDGAVQTLADLLAEKAPACGDQPAILHTASSVDGASLYACAAPDCDVAEQLTAADILDVVAVDGDWLAIQRGGRTLYLPSADVGKLSLEMRIRDATPTVQVHARCFISPHLGPGRELSIMFIIGGKLSDQVTVDLWQPNADEALPIASRTEEKDSHGLPVNVQRYAEGMDWSLGEYRIDLTVGGHRYPIAWEISRAGPYRVTLACD